MYLTHEFIIVGLLTAFIALGSADVRSSAIVCVFDRSRRTTRHVGRGLLFRANESLDQDSLVGGPEETWVGYK